MNKSGNIIIAGVGGQGIILASDLASKVLMYSGFDIKKSEVHGMAQRGGSVVAHIRFSKKVYSPLIEEGSGDVLLSFELMETLRYIPLLKKGADIIVNAQKILPPSVARGIEPYPKGVMEEMSGKGFDVIGIDAFKEAGSLGEKRVVNIVMLGALSAFMPVKESVFVDAIRERVPEKLREINISAFERGRRIAAVRAKRGGAR